MRIENYCEWPLLEVPHYEYMGWGIIEWLEENLPEKSWYWKTVCVEENINRLCYIHIENETDAVAFKLRWL